MLLVTIFVAVQFASLFTPPLLDDADASHAQIAQHMAETGDLVTAKVDGIRYLEKPPLPYWIDAGLYRVFGQNVFATHLPNALALLGCAWLAWLWASTRLGTPRRPLCCARNPHRDRSVSIYPLLHSRGDSQLSVAARPLLLSHRHGVEAPRPLLRHVGRAGPGHAHQGADRAGLLCRRGNSLCCC